MIKSAPGLMTYKGKIIVILTGYEMARSWNPNFINNKFAGRGNVSDQINLGVKLHNQHQLLWPLLIATEPQRSSNNLLEGINLYTPIEWAGAGTGLLLYELLKVFFGGGRTLRQTQISIPNKNITEFNRAIERISLSPKPIGTTLKNTHPAKQFSKS
jgi:hypothetical protein